MKKALITGISGQDGSYLAEWLLEKGYCVHGLVQDLATESLTKIQPFRDKIFLHIGDLKNTNRLKGVLDAIQPDEVYNLAAISHINASFDSPEETADVDAVGVLRLLEALRFICPKARFFQASSSQLFGRPIDFPQQENTPFCALSPYAIAKLFAHWTVISYRESFNIHASNGILFNHESPRRGYNFVSRKISLAVAKIHLGLQEEIILGNLDAKRDWGYAKDFVQAMWLMLQQDAPDDYILATGRASSVRDFVELAFQEIGIAIDWEGRGVEEIGRDKGTGKIYVRVSKELYRSSEINYLLGNSSKAKEKLGWKASTSLKELVSMMIAADLEALKENKDFIISAHY